GKRGLPPRRGAVSIGEVLLRKQAGGGRMKLVGQPVPHESALAHVAGSAPFTDDLLSRFPRLLHAWPVLAPHAHARLISLGASGAQAVSGMVKVLTARDVPGEADSGPVRHDEPIFADEILFHSQ